MPCMNIDEVAPEKTYNVLFVGSSNVGKTGNVLIVLFNFTLAVHSSEN